MGFAGPRWRFGLMRFRFNRLRFGLNRCRNYCPRDISLDFIAQLNRGYI